MQFFNNMLEVSGFRVFGKNFNRLPQCFSMFFNFTLNTLEHRFLLFLKSKLMNVGIVESKQNLINLFLVFFKSFKHTQHRSVCLLKTFLLLFLKINYFVLEICDKYFDLRINNFFEGVICFFEENKLLEKWVAFFA